MASKDRARRLFYQAFTWPPRSAVPCASTKCSAGRVQVPIASASTIALPPVQIIRTLPRSHQLHPTNTAYPASPPCNREIAGEVEELFRHLDLSAGRTGFLPDLGECVLVIVDGDRAWFGELDGNVDAEALAHRFLDAGAEFFGPARSGVRSEFDFQWNRASNRTWSGSLSSRDRSPETEFGSVDLTALARRCCHC